MEKTQAYKSADGEYFDTVFEAYQHEIKVYGGEIEFDTGKITDIVNNYTEKSEGLTNKLLPVIEELKNELKIYLDALNYITSGESGSLSIGEDNSEGGLSVDDEYKDLSF